MSESGLSVYDVIEQHRGFWLRRRGRSSIRNPNPIKVYLDGGGSSYGTVSVLREIPAEEVESIEYYNATEAQTRFGLDNSSGAIVVNTKAGK